MTHVDDFALRVDKRGDGRCEMKRAEVVLLASRR